MTSLFAVVRDELLMPALDQCGVASVPRAELLAMSPRSRAVEWWLDALSATSAVFSGSSVRGILPVQSLDGPNFVPVLWPVSCSGFGATWDW